MDVLTKMKKQLYQDYLTSVKRLKANEFDIRRAVVLAKKLRETFVGCILYEHISPQSQMLSLYLNENFNIEKDVSLFIDNHLYLLGPDYEVRHDQSNQSLDYTWQGFTLYVYYGNGRCQRVKVDTIKKVVEEDIYEIKCY